MIVPAYWAEGRVHEKRDGKQVTIRRFGWSDESQAAAQAHADDRAREAFAAFKASGTTARFEYKRAYNGADGVPIREEILERHGDTIITRNGYGARCLNTPNVLFADVDVRTEGFAATMRNTFGGLLRFVAPTALATLGYEEPTPIQKAPKDPSDPRRCSPAATCSARPPRAPARPRPSRCRSCSALPGTRAARATHRGAVLVPTRELAMQVAEAVHKYGKGLGVACSPIYGGQSMETQLRARPRRRRRRRDAGTRARPHDARTLDLDEREHGRPRRGRRDARHGLRRGPRGDPRARRPRRADGALLGDDAAAHRRIAKKHLRDPVKIDRA
jgi:hypothetical protein